MWITTGRLFIVAARGLADLFRRRVLLIAGAVLALGLSGYAQPAAAAELTLPGGYVAKVTNVKFGACNNLSYGYQLDAEEGPEGKLASFPGGCGEAPGPNATIGPYGGAHVLRFYLEDNTCGFTFYSDGSGGSGEHAKITGTNPYLVQLRDGGGFCEYPPGQPIPPSGGGNLEATVTIEPAPVEAPEFGRCKKVAGKAGKYSDKACTENAAGSKTESKFEWFPGPGPKNKFTAKGGSSTLFETNSGYSSGCASEKASGEYVPLSNNKHLTASLVFTGCKVISSPGGVINGASCQTIGQAAGEVIDNPLVGEVGWQNKATNETALALGAAAGYAPNFTPTIDCGGYNFQVRTYGGGLLVFIRNNAMGKK